MNKKIKRILISIGIVVAIIALITFNKMASKDSISDIYTQVEEGSFDITVSAAGELIPEKSIDITGPALPKNNNRRGRRQSRIHVMDLKIADIVPEGTIVNKGDYIAQLDRTTFDNTLKDETERLEEMQANLHMEILDTAVVLTNLRDEIKNQTFAVEEATITLEKSKFEPPATIRQAEIELDKAKRKLSQQKKLYKLKVAQQLKEINKIKIDIEGQIRTVNDLENYLEGFTVRAPSSGMVIYKRNRNGTKRKVGSTINPFDMVIATLPDLSSMISKTYVSEIDVSKIKPGQKVNVKIDAYRDKVYSATVINVAKIGEQLPNSDTKMFEVLSRIDESDPRLRPSMTTGNDIIISSFENVVYIPLECVHTESDGIPFVYTKNRTKQVVVLGESNDKYVIVNRGLKSGTAIYLYTPENPDKFKLAGEALIPLISQTLTNR
jgi:multidrug efflux pump subunit AcrA (membrane-fusion protein)